MTRTTRPVATSRITARPKPIAPRYPTVKADTYSELDAGEKRRADLHAAVDVICDAEPRARLDRDAIGFSDSYRLTDGSRSTKTVDAAATEEEQDEAQLNSVEAASQRRDYAQPWLVQVAKIRGDLRSAERVARYNWPSPLPPGTVISQDGQELTVGQRGNSVPVCAWCGHIAPSGRENGVTLARKIGDHTVHSKNCYQQTYRKAAEDHTTLIAVLTAKTNERKVS